MSGNYGLYAAFEDVSRVVIQSAVPMAHERRVRAAHLLHTLIRAGLAAGLPEEPAEWPAGNPASWVVEAIRTAGPPQNVKAYAPANCSAWALREAAAEIGLGESIAQENRSHQLEPGEDDLEGRFTAETIAALYDQADYVEEHAELPVEDELDDFDADVHP